MRQKSSVPQAASLVSQALKPDSKKSQQTSRIILANMSAGRSDHACAVFNRVRDRHRCRRLRLRGDADWVTSSHGHRAARVARRLPAPRAPVE